MNIDLTVERLRKLLRYDADTGEFVWLGVNPGKGTRGKVAGGINPTDGRRRVRVDGVMYQSHRLAWLYVYGEWPKQHLDHIDGNPKNNRIDNLRDVSQNINMQNRRKASSSSKTGLLGAFPWYSKFVAQITFDGKTHSLGVHNTALQAHEAYLIAKRKHHEGCTI